MPKVLEELWRGNLAPQEMSFYRGAGYDEAFKMMCKNEETLIAMLKGKEKETFEKFCACKDEVDLFMEENIFITGFRLGARMMIESFYQNDGLFRETGA